jgi:glycosyltransferase involved in cell wall biosynthesis
MRVLLVFSSSELGGAERSLSRMALVSQKVNYQLATLEGEGPWCDWVRSEGHEPLVLGRKSAGSRAMLTALLHLILHVRRYPAEVIYICGARASLMLRLLRVFLPGTKLVNGIRWNPDSSTRLDRFFRLMERFTHRLVDAWITNSEVAKQTLESRCGIPSEHIFVIYNGLMSLPADLTPLRDRSMYVLTVANLNPRKGHREYLKIIRQVLNSVPDAKFVFVGRDDMNGEVQKAIKEACLSENVYFIGFQHDVSDWFRKARVMVLPSLWGEGCPTSILEGFSFGLPVVAYSIDGIPELIENGIDGVLVSLDCSNELGSAIVHILQNTAVAESMGATGKAKVADQFTVARCADEHARVFRKVISIK